MATIIRRSPDLLGGRYFCVGATNRYLVSCRDSRKIVNIDSANFGAVLSSTSVAFNPGAICYSAGTIYCICEDGYLRVFTQSGDTLSAVVSTTNVYTGNSNWLWNIGATVVCPWGWDGIQLISGGVVISQLASGLSRIQNAYLNGTRLYCFDGRGIGVVLTITGSTITRGEQFSIPSGVNVDCIGLVSSTVLGIGANSNPQYITLNITAPDAPVWLSRTLEGKSISAVVADGPLISTDLSPLSSDAGTFNVNGGIESGSVISSLVNGAIYTKSGVGFNLPSGIDTTKSIGGGVFSTVSGSPPALWNPVVSTDTARFALVIARISPNANVNPDSGMGTQGFWAYQNSYFGGGGPTGNLPDLLNPNLFTRALGSTGSMTVLFGGSPPYPYPASYLTGVLNQGYPCTSFEGVILNAGGNCAVKSGYPWQGPVFSRMFYGAGSNYGEYSGGSFGLATFRVWWEWQRKTPTWEQRGVSDAMTIAFDVNRYGGVSDGVTGWGATSSGGNNIPTNYWNVDLYTWLGTILNGGVKSDFSVGWV